MAKPVVDRIEKELEGKAKVYRISALSKVGMEMARSFGVRGVPTILAFDGAGNVTYEKTGILNKEETVRAALGAGPLK